MPAQPTTTSSSSRASIGPSGGGHRQSIHPGSSSSSSSTKPPVQFSSSITLSDSAQLIGRHTIIISTDSVVHPRARLDSSYGRVNVGRRCIVQERACLGGLFDLSTGDTSAPAGGARGGNRRDSLTPAAAGANPRDSLRRGDSLHAGGGGRPSGTSARDSMISTGSSSTRDSFYGAGTMGRAVLTGRDGVGMGNWGKQRKSAMELGNGASMVVLGDYVTVEVGAMLEPGVRVEEGATIGVGSVVGAGAEIGKYCTLAPYSVIQPGDKMPDYTVVFCGSQRRTDKRAPAQADFRHKVQVKQIEVTRRMIKSDPSKFL